MTVSSSGRPVLTTPGRRGLALLAVGLLAVIGLLYVVVPAVAGLDEIWTRPSSGDPLWLLVALLFEVLSFVSNMAFFRAVFERRDDRGGSEPSPSPRSPSHTRASLVTQRSPAG